MQTNTILKLIPITFVAAGFFLGCGEAHDHEHTDGDGHDHGDGGHQENVAATDDYPLTTCLVDDSNKLGSMGKAFVHVHEGVTVKFCCEGCLKDFNEEPKKFLAKLEAAKKGELPKPAPKGEEKPEAEETQPAPKETEGENN